MKYNNKPPFAHHWYLRFFRPPPLNKRSLRPNHSWFSFLDTPRTEIHRREQNVAGPPVNRASALRYYATRQRMDQLVGDSIYSYDPRRSKMRKSRQSQSLPRSLNNSTHSINQGSLRSSRLSSQSRLSNSNYSVIHPLSGKIKLNDRIDLMNI